ncbi:MAG: tRNA pseudouridine(38-40) synthase TruA [Clostridia bacterium]|nr:tRNA pseudouridine(38-40) synthase TruA [Clostridia bacterium]
MRYLMHVTYNGQNYNGYQKQASGSTIQSELEKAIFVCLKDEVTCTASGRTDAKVSAYNQPVHFETEKAFDLRKFLKSINGILPEDIKVLKIEPTTLHARFSAKRKTYVYKMYVSDVKLPLYECALNIPSSTNLKIAKQFCKMVVGTHNFKGFEASGSETETTVRTIYSCKLKKENGMLNFYVTGNGFLYKMVRNLVGTMLAVSNGKIDLKTLKTTMFSTYKCTHTAKPDYLYLYNVKYQK